MPNFERNLKQTATFWVPNGHDMFGKHTFSAPVQLPCRWENKSELFLDKKGQDRHSRAKVFLSSPVDLSGYLYLGTSAALDPLVVSGAYEIMMIIELPDLKNLKTLYVAML